MADTDERTDEQIIEDGINSINKVRSETQNLALDNIITMYEIDFSTILTRDNTDVESDPSLLNVIRFSSDCLENGNPITFGGFTYTLYPIEAEGFERGSEGTMPTPTIKVSNVLGGVSSILQEYNDLVGATVRRIRTFRKFLDDMPTADPDCTHRYRLWRPNDLLPEGGQFDYSCAECPYTGNNYFLKDGSTTTSPADDACGKRLSDCKKRFGETAELPFGGFPGISR